MTVVVLLFVTLIGVAITPRLTAGWSAGERKLAYLSLAAHVISAPAQELIYRKFYGYGDMFVYEILGERIADVVARDTARMLPEAFALLMQREHHLPLQVFGSGSSTGSMCAVSALLNLLVGPSLTSKGAAIALLSYTGKCFSHRVLRGTVAPEAQLMVAGAQLLLPTTVFWSAALLKEAVIGGAVGWLTWAMGSLIHRRTPLAAMVAVVCIIIIGLFKAYLLVGFAVGAGAWIYATRTGISSRVMRIRPSWLLAGAMVSVAMVAAVGELFPQYDIDEIGGRIAVLQSNVEEGGSSYSIGDAGERSLVGQMTFAPVALISTFFRPFPFEITSATAAVNAVESSLVLWLFVMVARRITFAELLRRVLSVPPLAFALTYGVVLSVGVGLATTNLGTLSRYRAPFYGVIVTLGVLLYVPRSSLGVRVAGAPRSRIRRGKTSEVTSTSLALEARSDA